MSIDGATETGKGVETLIELAEWTLRLGKYEMGRKAPADFWDAQAVLPLAGLLYAAGAGHIGGPGMAVSSKEDSMQWVTIRRLRLRLAWVRSAVTNTDLNDLANPGWAQAAQICAPVHPMLSWELVALMQLDHRQRDSIAMAILAALDEFGAASRPSTLATA
ncbi:MAG: hypothetical protein K0U78_20230 [Actinomycetia bacterium]|nr:hypothetical protein [Actinomycetes bacterium]